MLLEQNTKRLEKHRSVNICGKRDRRCFGSVTFFYQNWGKEQCKLVVSGEKVGGGMCRTNGMSALG